MVDSHFQDGVTDGREESPAVEYAFQDAVSAVIKTLLETKGLYQNVRVDPVFAARFVETGKLAAEFAKRPLFLISRGEAEPGGGFGAHTGAALGTPTDEMEAGCYLPNINLACHGCTTDTSFLSLQCSHQSRCSDPYPRIGIETEQVYSLTYQCATCRDAVITFQLLRKGYRFQVTGRTIPFRPRLAREWPKSIRKIVNDAFVAATENDMAAAFYHLRTAIEFHIKTELAIPIETKCEGTELCEQYNATLDDQLKSRFPSVAALYTDLSAGLHSRNVTDERFQDIVKSLLAHFKAKELFAEYTP